MGANQPRASESHTAKLAAGRSPRIRRFLEDSRTLFSVEAPSELVPAEHFVGTDVLRNRFSFYGESIELGDGIDWDRNPGSSHWGHDLNRFGFLVLDDQNPSQARAMEGLILDWIAKNDQPRYRYTPYAWQNLLNIAIRIENWFRFLAARSQSGTSELDAENWIQIKSSVFRQLIVLLRLIRKRGFESNWALIGLRSALYLLYSIDSFPHREKLIQIAWHDLRKAIERQILPDGVQQELSPHYHWVALEIIWSISVMAKQSGRPEQDELNATIASMADFLNALILPDGGIVSLGDSDFDYGPRIRNFLSQIDSENDTQPNTTSVKTYPYAGVAIVRDLKAGHVLAFDAGPLGTAHQHEDALSFWLTAFGEHCLIDPGRYLYDYSAGSMYSFLCSSAAHSTILVDDQGQNAKRHPDRWRRRAGGMPVVECESDIVRLVGRYSDGYGKKTADVEHQRTILCDMKNAVWTIVDRIEGAGLHSIEARFQCAPCAWYRGDGFISLLRGRTKFRIEYSSDWDDVTVLEGSRSPMGGWFSPGVNKLAPAPCLSLRGSFALPFETRTVIKATVID